MAVLAGCYCCWNYGLFRDSVLGKSGTIVLIMRMKGACMEYRIRIAGDSALLIEFKQEIKQETNQKIKAILQWLKEQSIEGILDLIPAFASLLISYDPRLLSYDSLINQLDALLQQEVKENQDQQRIIEIPVCYGGAYGPIYNLLPRMPV